MSDASGFSIPATAVCAKGSGTFRDIRLDKP